MSSTRFWPALWLLAILPFPLHADEAAKDPAADKPAADKTAESKAPDGKTPAGMILVPAGAFLMGTNQGDPANFNLRMYNDALPQHSVTLPAFYIDKTEVTNAQYKRYCDATHYPVPPNWKNGTYAEGDAEVPVAYVNWWEADAYASWAGKRLPTEAEWEKAARGTDGRHYPWGNDWDPNRIATGLEKPLPVGSKATDTSPYGLLDMSGNVMEWVNDWYAAYPGATITYPQYGTIYKVVRGGFFWGPGTELGASTFYRNVNRPATRHKGIGFRCAKSAPEAAH